MAIEVTDDLVPLKLPHFELRESKLYFLASLRPRAALDPPDLELWGHLDGATTVAQLRRGWPDAPARLERFWSLGLCEFAPARFPPGRRRILIIEPHMDDAAISVGGTIWARRGECEFTAASVVGPSPFSRYFYQHADFFDVARVTAIRTAESEVVMRMLGGRHVDLGQPDSPLRYNDATWSLSWYGRNREPLRGFMHHAPTEPEADGWAATLEGLLATTDAEEVWLPLGVGDHADHERTRDASLRALAALPAAGHERTIRLYQDVPYSLRFPAHTAQIVRALTEAGGALEMQAEDIGTALDGKCRLCACFASQFSRAYIVHQIESAARLASPSGAGRFELLYRVTRLPGPLPALAAFSGRPAVERLVPRLRRWYRRHRSAPRIRVLSPEPVGRWKEDLAYLLESFPDATLEMHVSEANVAETERLTSPRIEVRVVPSGGWLRRMARIATSGPCPTVCLESARGGIHAALVRAWASATGALSATKMDHFVLALRAVREGSP